MPNLMLTTSCNLKCDYCFAVDAMSTYKVSPHMDISTFESIMEWIERANRPELSIQLMGGEPTLSPLFFKILQELQHRSRKVMVFSNGTIPLASEIFEHTNREQVDWIININHPSVYSTVTS
mgnify:CR=1 FL=1